MRNMLVLLATLIATTSIAAADDRYLGFGAMAGADAGVDAQASVEGGYRLDGGTWLHAAAASGWAGDDQGGGRVHQVRAGIEGRTCTQPEGILCAVAGADLGYQAFTWHSQDMSSPDEPHHDAIVVVRLGGDIGGQHVRVRPGIEAISTTSGLIGINLTLGVAYQW